MALVTKKSRTISRIAFSPSIALFFFTYMYFLPEIAFFFTAHQVLGSLVSSV